MPQKTVRPSSAHKSGSGPATAFVGTNLTKEPIASGLPVMLPRWATANRERQGALTESRTTIAGDPFYREWLCGAGQGCRGRILERLYIDNLLAFNSGIISSACLFHSEPASPHRIAASSVSMFISFRALNRMQYPVTLALPSFFPYVLAKYFLSLRPRI